MVMPSSSVRTMVPTGPDQSVDPMTLTGENRVKWVQNRLLELGYTDGGPVDGSLNLKTQGTILDFRNRNGLPLVAGIDNDLIAMLFNGPTIELPIEQTTAQTPAIAEKVGAVRETWYARFWSKVLAIPSVIIAAVTGTISSFGDAVTLMQPIKLFLEERLSSISPLTLTAIIGSVTTVLAIILWRKSANTEGALVEGYRIGTLKNDVDAAKEV